MADKSVKLIRLDKGNYIVWKWQFVNVLKANKLQSVLGAEPVSEEQDGQAMALLGSALSEENILKIINCNSFKTAWQALEQCFENKTSYEPQALYRV